jgi:hypothetical protein
VDPLAGEQVVAMLPSTRSVAEAVNVYVAPLVRVASTVAFAGTVMTGAVVSLTVTVNDAVLRLPCASVAAQVTAVGPNGKVDPLAGVQVAAIGPSSASVPKAVKVKGAPAVLVASTVALGGTVMTGPVVSVTVTVNDAVLRLPCASVAAQETVVGPNGKVDPLAGAHIGASGPSRISVANAVKVWGAPAALVASTVALAGTVTTGPVVSVTVTVNHAVLRLPCASVAAQVTVVGPNGKVDPLAGAHIGASGPSRISVADAVKVWGAPAALVASTVAFAGTVTTGPVVSVTVTVNDAVLRLPCASVAAQVTVVGPNGKVDPLAGAQVVASGPSRTSVADAVNV